MLSSTLALGIGLFAGSSALAQTPDPDRQLADALAALEQRAGGRLGVAVLDTRAMHVAGHRLDERFTMCSVFKLSLAAAILNQVEEGEIARDATLPITELDPVGHSPEVRERLAKGERTMSVLALAEAAQVQSDNGAANILLRHMGGPAGLTAFWRQIGDPISRLDRYEPHLNLTQQGDLRDSTTPLAMARTMRVMLLGMALHPAVRTRLIDWMAATRTGLERLRAGLPAGWRVGDKTGTMTGEAQFGNKINDVAICWRPERAEPFLISAFYEPDVRGDLRLADERVLLDAGHLASVWMVGRG